MPGGHRTTYRRSAWGMFICPALAGIVIGTFITVPVGARAAHRLPVAKLKQIFGIVLLVLATKMLLSLF